jgi:hypothetical protein
LTTAPPPAHTRLAVDKAHAGRQLRQEVRFAYRVASATPFAAFSMSDATAWGCDTYTAAALYLDHGGTRTIGHRTLNVWRNHLSSVETRYQVTSAS